MQGFKWKLTLKLNLNFFVQGAFSFHSSVGTQNQSTIHLVGLEGRTNHPASKSRVICVNVNKHTAASQNRK